jgi:hypothetical protein
MGQEQFRVQPRGLDAFSGEEIAAALDDFNHGHAAKVGSKFKVQRAKFNELNSPG